MVKYLIKWASAFLILWCLLSCYQCFWTDSNKTDSIKEELVAQADAYDKELQQLYQVTNELKQERQQLEYIYNKLFSKSMFKPSWWTLLGEYLFKSFQLLHVSDQINSDISTKLITKSEIATKLAQEELKDSVLIRLPEAFKTQLPHAFYTLLAIWISSILWKVIAYYILAKYLEHRQGFSFMNADHDSQPPTPGTEQANFAERHGKRITVSIAPGQSLTIKQEDFLASYAKKQGIRKRTVWLFSRQYWLMSLINGLSLMTRLSLDSKATTPFQADISSSSDPDTYFLRVDLTPNLPLMIMPSSLVAYSGDIHLRVHWRFWNLVSWCIGQIRYYTISGTGYIVLQGQGGLTQNSQDDMDGDHVIKMRALAAISSRRGLQVQRTETFIPYFLGMTDLLDMRISGEGIAVQRNVIQESQTLLGKTRDSIFSIIGKLLGF